MRTALLLIGIFVFGGVTGAAAMRTYDLSSIRTDWKKTPERRIHAKVETLRRNVGIDDTQAKAIEDIYRTAEPERQQASASCRPAMDAQRESMEAKIAEVLRPDQRVKFDEIRKPKQ